MTKKNRALALALVIVVAAALVAIFTQSRTFAQIMGQGYAPEKVDAIHVYLSAVDRDTPSREVFLSGEDPATQDLLALLGSQTYRVNYEVGAREGHPVLLDYTVALSLTMAPEGDQQTVAAVYLDGSSAADIRGLDPAEGDHTLGVRTHYQADLAFQQEVLNLLLAQPYEEIL